MVGLVWRKLHIQMHGGCGVGPHAVIVVYVVFPAERSRGCTQRLMSLTGARGTEVRVCMVCTRQCRPPLPVHTHRPPASPTAVVCPRPPQCPAAPCKSLGSHVEHFAGPGRRGGT